jgi:uncharacterized protein YbjT (DUF2867 family)
LGVFAVALVLVTGPAGTLGSALIPALTARGHEVRVLVHHTTVAPSAPVEVVAGDVSTGEGVLEAMTGVDAVIHAATSPLRRAKATDIDGTAHLLRAAESVAAHFVYPSIVGIDQIGGTYYRAKLSAERLVESTRRWTIQRATQFHPLIDQMLAMRLFPVTRHMAFQPVDAAEIADLLVDIVEAGPAGRLEDFGGPQVLSLPQLAAARRATTGRHARLIRVPALGPLRALDAGRNLSPGHARGHLTWQSWLDSASLASDG